jgi:hypothetical protein
VAASSEDKAQVSNWFNNNPLSQRQTDAITRLRMRGNALAAQLLEDLPECTARTEALRRVREAVMLGCEAVRCGE